MFVFTCMKVNDYLDKNRKKESLGWCVSQIRATRTSAENESPESWLSFCQKTKGSEVVAGSFVSFRCVEWLRPPRSLLLRVRRRDGDLPLERPPITGLINRAASRSPPQPARSLCPVHRLMRQSRGVLSRSDAGLLNSYLTWESTVRLLSPHSYV